MTINEYQFAANQVLGEYVSILDKTEIGETNQSRIDRFTNLFTSDGIWTEHYWNAGNPTDDGCGCVVQGEVQLRQFAEILINSTPAHPLASARHNLVSPYIVKRGDEIHVGANWIQTRDGTVVDGQIGVIATGRYYLILRKTGPDWKIAKMDLMADHPLHGTPLAPPCTSSGPTNIVS